MADRFRKSESMEPKNRAEDTELEPPDYKFPEVLIIRISIEESTCICCPPWNSAERYIQPRLKLFSQAVGGVGAHPKDLRLDIQTLC